MGKNADFVVIEKDIYEIDPDEIKTTKVDMTVLAVRSFMREKQKNNGSIKRKKVRGRV